MLFINLPYEIWNIILNFDGNIKDIYQFRLLCKETYKFYNTYLKIYYLKLPYNNKLGLHVIMQYDITYLNDRILSDLKHITNDSSYLTDDIIIKYKKLEYLYLSGIVDVTDKGIKTLMNLKFLRFSPSTRISDISIKNLINLEILKCSYCDITDKSIENLVNLKHLVCNNCNYITDKGIKKLTNLKYLYCNGCQNITNDGIKHISGLEILACRYCDNITDTGIENLLNLKILSCNNSNNVSTNCIHKLVNLEELRYYSDICIDYIDLTKLNKLKKIIFRMTIDDMHNLNDDYNMTDIGSFIFKISYN